MPYYNYTCKDCGNTQSERRDVNDRQTPSKCEICGGEAIRDLMGQTFGGMFGDNSKYK